MVSLKEGIKGELPKSTGKFNILLDEDLAGTKYFSLLVNEMHAGIKGVEHSHIVEHAWYILSGYGKMFMEGRHTNSGQRWLSLLQRMFRIKLKWMKGSP